MSVKWEQTQTKPVCVKRLLLSPVSFRTDAGVSVQLIHTLSSVLTAMLLTVVVVYAAVITDITRRAHTPATHKHNSRIKLNAEKTPSSLFIIYLKCFSLSVLLAAKSYLGPVDVMRQVD